MRIIRYQQPDSPAQYGWITGEKIGPIEGNIFGAFQREEAKTSLKAVRLLPPTTPSKIICVGRNYAAHAKEHGAEVPEVPLIFLKPPTSLIAHQEAIVLPPQSKQVEHEAELTVVIGRSGRWIETEFDPADAVVTCHVNSEMRQMASTRDMIFTVRQLIAFVSSVMTLEPGDLLLTGTPAGVSPLNPGDTVEVAIEGLGVLSNPVISSSRKS
jgi:2-keto-4-pentenoate hydratase/2-oxohepta-3-ene-1,7-dioic acid hydratase in catechol pathway